MDGPDGGEGGAEGGVGGVGGAWKKEVYVCVVLVGVLGGGLATPSSRLLLLHPFSNHCHNSLRHSSGKTVG